MKESINKTSALLLAAMIVIGIAAFSSYSATDVTDYSDLGNWAYYAVGRDTDADLFLICPTVDTNSGEFNMSLRDKYTKRDFLGALNMEKGIYEENTRMFAPYYRQASMRVYGLPEDEREQYLEKAYSDVSAAFAFYLKHDNLNRPIVLAGFSQGADMCYRLLEEYFGDGELYDRLVAVYAIGWPCSEEMTERFPQIRPAQSAEDIGVVISFDCEAPEVEDTFIYPAGSRAFSINPLNWKTDGTVADKSENLGAVFTDQGAEIISEKEALCGCYIDPVRGVVKVTDISAADYSAKVPGLPEGAYHVYDYQLFFRNLQKNVSERIARFLEIDAARRPEKPEVSRPSVTRRTTATTGTTAPAASDTDVSASDVPASASTSSTAALPTVTLMSATSGTSASQSTTAPVSTRRTTTSMTTRRTTTALTTRRTTTTTVTTRRTTTTTASRTTLPPTSAATTASAAPPTSAPTQSSQTSSSQTTAQTTSTEAPPTETAPTESQPTETVPTEPTTAETEPAQQPTSPSSEPTAPQEETTGEQ